MGNRLTPDVEAVIRRHHEGNPPIPCDTCKLLLEIDALRADLAASRAETAAAFSVAASVRIYGYAGSPEEGNRQSAALSNPFRDAILALTPQAATAALDELLQRAIDAGIGYGNALCAHEEGYGTGEPPKPTPASVRSVRP
jgi:hypothetical protein